MLIQKYQIAYRADNSPVANVLFEKPIDAENYINTMHNIMLYKSDVIIIPVFVASLSIPKNLL